MGGGYDITQRTSLVECDSVGHTQSDTRTSIECTPPPLYSVVYQLTSCISSSHTLLDGGTRSEFTRAISSPWLRTSLIWEQNIEVIIIQHSKNIMLFWTKYTKHALNWGKHFKVRYDSGDSVCVCCVGRSVCVEVWVEVCGCVCVVWVEVCVCVPWVGSEQWSLSADGVISWPGVPVCVCVCVCVCDYVWVWVCGCDYVWVCVGVGVTMCGCGTTVNTETETHVLHIIATKLQTAPLQKLEEEFIYVRLSWRLFYTILSLATSMKLQNWLTLVVR